MCKYLCNKDVRKWLVLAVFASQRYVACKYARDLKVQLYIYFITFTPENYFTMNKNSFIYRAFDLYYDGFKHMTVGKTLWTVILIKLFIMFAILKVFFFPDFIKQNSQKGDEADFVSTEMIKRNIH
mgnify:CR=1 FL=1